MALSMLDQLNVIRGQVRAAHAHTSACRRNRGNPDQVVIEAELAEENLQLADDRLTEVIASLGKFVARMKAITDHNGAES